MSCAPKDGTMLRLLVEFDDNATEDSQGACATIGANNFDHDQLDEWKFAGWNWTHDCFTEGVGTPIGWLPMLEAAPQPVAAVLTDDDQFVPLCFDLMCAKDNGSDAIKAASQALLDWHESQVQVAIAAHVQANSMTSGEVSAIWRGDDTEKQSFKRWHKQHRSLDREAAYAGWKGHANRTYLAFTRTYELGKVRLIKRQGDAVDGQSTPCCGEPLTCEKACVERGRQLEREACSKLAVQWGNARKDENGGNALRNYARALREGLQPCNKAAIEQEAEQRRETLDAARYHWLRDLSEPGICSFYMSVGSAFKNVKFARETVDEAIDAAIAKGVTGGA